MSTVTVRIITQYLENYGTSENPSWKPKGGQEFTIDINSDFVLYHRDECIEVFKEMIAKHDNDYNKYEYYDHNLMFWKSIPLENSNHEFNDLITEKI